MAAAPAQVEEAPAQVAAPAEDEEAPAQVAAVPSDKSGTPPREGASGVGAVESRDSEETPSALGAAPVFESEEGRALLLRNAQVMRVQGAFAFIVCRDVDDWVHRC